MPVYLDHNASTPVAPSIIEVMALTMKTHFANPSSTDHMAGAAAAKVIDKAREFIAQEIGARPTEIVFTSGATEANCLAIRGAFYAQKEHGRRRVVTSATEHPSVLRTVEALVEHGAEAVVLPVDRYGRLDLEELATVITSETALVTVMAANNETGVLHPVAAIGELCSELGVLFHSDLTQLVGYAPINVQALGLHLASLSAHKMYGPKGVGALYARTRRPRARITPLQTGGGQERGLRSGTLNTEGIVGFGEAFHVRRDHLKNVDTLRERRDRLEAQLLAMKGVQRNGDPSARLPHTTNLSIGGIEPHALQHALRESIVFSTSSACSTDKVETSPVLVAMFGDGPRAREGFRLGLGFGTTDEDTATAGDAFEQAVERLRSGTLGRRRATNFVQ